MKSIRPLIFSFAIALQAIFVGSFSARAAAPLKLEEAIIVPDSKGGFDYLQVDDAKRRLLANHTGNNTLDVFDVDSGKLLKRVLRDEYWRDRDSAVSSCFPPRA